MAKYIVLVYWLVLGCGVHNLAAMDQGATTDRPSELFPSLNALFLPPFSISGAQQKSEYDDDTLRRKANELTLRELYMWVNETQSPTAMEYYNRRVLEV
ncbi:hypothetical protein IWQ61_010219, partial [Dispira simplex]